MHVLRILTLLFSISQVASQNYIQYGSLECEVRHGGQCKARCRLGEFIVGRGPCAFGRLGTCCLSTLPCSRYGGVCRAGGCLNALETTHRYTVRCPRRMTCCIRRTRRVEAAPTGRALHPAIRPPPFLACVARPPLSPSPGRILWGVSVTSSCLWPWVVSVKLATPTGPDLPLCSGVLVSNDKVITTATCVFRNNVYVTLGENNVTRYGEKGEVNMALRGAPLIHPNYDKTGSSRDLKANDIAILTLAKPVTSSDACSRPVCLPRPTGRVSFSSQCYIAGWGSNLRGDGLLHEANVHVFNNAMCSLVMSLGLNRVLSGDKLCSSPYQSGACPGDNGGMLVCEGARGTWSLFGIISDNACSPHLPIIYTDVRSHQTWIANNI